MIIALTSFLSACGNENSGESREVREASNKVILLESGILGMRSACQTDGEAGCRDLAAILEHNMLVFAARCDKGTSLTAKFEVRKEGGRSDELYVTWHHVDAGSSILDDSRRYVAAISGENVDVGYLVGQGGALSNRAYREKMRREVPNAFALLAHHNQGNCVRLK